MNSVCALHLKLDVSHQEHIHRDLHFRVPHQDPGPGLLHGQVYFPAGPLELAGFQCHPHGVSILTRGISVILFIILFVLLTKQTTSPGISELHSCVLNFIPKLKHSYKGNYLFQFQQTSFLISSGQSHFYQARGTKYFMISFRFSSFYNLETA